MPFWHPYMRSIDRTIIPMYSHHTLGLNCRSKLISIGTNCVKKTSFPFQHNIGRVLDARTRTNRPNNVREEGTKPAQNGTDRLGGKKGFWEATKCSQPMSEKRVEQETGEPNRSEPGGREGWENFTGFPILLCSCVRGNRYQRRMYLSTIFPADPLWVVVWPWKFCFPSPAQQGKAFPVCL